MNRWIMKLLMLMSMKTVLRADTLQEECPERMKTDLCTEGHVRQKKRKEYSSCASRQKDLHDNHMKMLSRCQST